MANAAWALRGNMKRQWYIYGAGGVVVVAAAVGIVMATHHAKPQATPAVSTSTAQTGDVRPITQKDIKTPTDNSALSNTLNDDAASMDADIQNVDNGSYNDSNLTDNALYR